MERGALHPNSRLHSAVEKRPGADLPSGFVRTNEMRGRAVVQKVKEGWLIGFNAGEFGGGLWWSDESGHHTTRLTSENIWALIPRGEAVLVFSGLAHLTVDEGRVYLFSTNNSSRLVLLAELGSEPSASVTEDSGAVLISTHKGVLRFTAENRVEPVYENRALGLLYPNSILEDGSGGIVVGMRFYVLRLKPNGGAYKAVWYVPSACTKTRFNNYDCECVSKP